MRRRSLRILLASAVALAVLPGAGSAAQAGEGQPTTTVPPPTTLPPTTTVPPTTTGPTVTVGPPPPPGAPAPPTTVEITEELLEDLDDGAPEHYATQPAFDETTRQVLAVPLAQARRRVRVVEARVADLELLKVDLAERATAVEHRYQDLTLRRTDLVISALDARAVLDAHAVESYLRGDDAGFSVVLEATDANDAGQRRELVRSVLDNDEREMVAAEERLERATDELRRLVEARLDARRRHRKASMLHQRAMAELERARFEVTTYEIGGHIVVQGFTFPVLEPTSFYDGWGDPRMPGTIYTHWHEGTDIMAASGTPLLAAERGVISSVRSHILGGQAIWIDGASGVRYYYAHLSRYEEGVVRGTEVAAGDVIGYVGDTGNARGTPHLHFEIHVDGQPINPYPILRVAWELRLRELEAEGAEEVPDVTTGPLESDSLGPAPG